MVTVEGDPTVFGTVTLESGLSGSDKICFPPRTTEYEVLIIANEDAEYETEYYMRRYGFNLPGIAWRLEDEDGQHIYSFGPSAPAGAGNLHTTNKLSWKDYANDKSSNELWRLGNNFMWFGIECETPTDTSGYDITEQYVAVTSSSSDDQFTIYKTCATGYYGNPSATRCTGPYSPAPCRYINEENVYITSENRYLPTSAATTGCFSAGPYTLSGCTACADIMNDIAGVLDGSCTQCGGSNPGNCTSASCDTGYHSFVDGVGCSECTPVAHAEADAIYSCTTATDSRATGGCAAGFWKDNSGSADVCIECTPVAHAEADAIYSCTTATDSRATGGCAAGFWKDNSGSADVCIECTPVAHAGTGAIYSCSTAADSVVVACRGEYFLNEGSCDAWSPECETHQIMTRGASNSQDRICQEKCADERSPHMIANDKYCESWPSLGQMCTKSRWRSLKYCQQSCSTLGFGYEDDECPLQYVCSNKRSPHMLEKGKFCESWSHLRIMCARPRWNEKKFCEQSCFDSGLGYAGGGC